MLQLWTEPWIHSGVRVDSWSHPRSETHQNTPWWRVCTIGGLMSFMVNERDIKVLFKKKKKKGYSSGISILSGRDGEFKLYMIIWIFHPLYLNWRHSWDVWTINIYILGRHLMSSARLIQNRCIYIIHLLGEMGGRLTRIDKIWTFFFRYGARGPTPHHYWASKARWCLGFPLWRKMWHVWRAAKESRALIVNLFLCSKWSNGMLVCL